jgi:putative redox protein
MMHSLKVTFPGSSGDPLAARLELPLGSIRSYAIFAHCFTCSKDLFASRRIASELAMRGIAVLRFDFTGLGASDGEFANSNFSSNVEDLRRAAQYLASHFGPAELLIGHSLGGAAVLAVAADLPEVRAVVTIGAPADTEHVIHSFRTHVPVIESQGEAEVELAGRSFTIRRQFLDDVRGQHLEAKIRDLGRSLLILHAPGDEIVGIENAKRIFAAARHPKSFISLDGADHLLTRHEDATFVAEVVSAWFARYLAQPSSARPAADHDDVLVRASGEGRFQQVVEAGRHRLLADEPESYGGLDSGPSPYDLVAAGLGACTSMTLQLYAERKGWQLPPYTVEVWHAKVHADDYINCGEGRNGKIDQFERRITFETDPGPVLSTWREVGAASADIAIMSAQISRREQYQSHRAT